MHGIQISFRGHTRGLWATSSPNVLPNPNHPTTPMNHLTSHEVLAFVIGLPTIASLQRITVQMQRMCCLVLQNPMAFFLGNPHLHRMLGGIHDKGIQHETYFIFFDMAAHCVQPNHTTYVIVKVDRWTREPLDVDPSTIVPSARKLL